jgi:hypothetical protein
MLNAQPASSPIAPMKTPSRQLVGGTIGLLLLMLLAGCDRKPDRVEVPKLDPAAVAQGAMQKYDANNDGAVDGDELERPAACGIIPACRTS